MVQCNVHVVDAPGHLQLWQNCLFSLYSVDFRRTRAFMVLPPCCGLGSRQLEDPVKTVRDNHIVWVELQITFSHVTKWHIDSQTHQRIILIYIATNDLPQSLTEMDRWRMLTMTPCCGLGSRQLEDPMKTVRDNHIVWVELQITFSHVTKWHIDSQTHQRIILIYIATNDLPQSLTEMDRWRMLIPDHFSVSDKDRKGKWLVKSIILVSFSV